MKITVTKKDDIVYVNLENETNGNDFDLKLTPEDARALAEKIIAALADLS